MHSPIDGIIQGRVTMPAVISGDAVYPIGKLSNTEHDKLDWDLDEILTRYFHNRTLEDLATNIVVQE